MEVILLGTGTALVTARRGSPALAVKVGAGTEYILFDIGSGTLRRLAEAGIDLGRIRHVFATHRHVDHVGDLAPLLFARRSPALRGAGPLALHGGAPFAAMVQGLRAVFGDWLDGSAYGLEVRDFPKEGVSGDGWIVTGFPVRHIEGSLAYRIEDARGRVVCVSGDTDVCPGIVQAGRGADILVLECSFPDARKVEGHLGPRECGRIARDARARRLVLTHFYPEMDLIDARGPAEREIGGGGDVIVGEDLMRIRI